ADGYVRVSESSGEPPVAEEAARSRLGRGLAALIGDVGAESSSDRRGRPRVWPGGGHFRRKIAIQRYASIRTGQGGEAVTLNAAADDAARLNQLLAEAAMTPLPDDDGLSASGL